MSLKKKDIGVESYLRLLRSRYIMEKNWKMFVEANRSLTICFYRFRNFDCYFNRFCYYKFMLKIYVRQIYICMID